MTRPLPELVATWEAAEARLYPVVMTRPEIYERSLALVHEIVAELAPYGTTEGLAEAFDRAAEITARAIDRSGVRADGVDAGLAAAAAFALRYRGVLAATARAEALTHIADARARDETWVTVADSGDAIRGPYHRLDLHLRDGGCVLRSIGLDAETGEPRFGVEAYLADPMTGDRLPDAGSLVAPVTYRSRNEWDEAVERVRGLVERGRG
jgi:hypothetical protein